VKLQNGITKDGKCAQRSARLVLGTWVKLLGTASKIVGKSGFGHPKKIERGVLSMCHKFEYLTLLNSCQDAKTRDRQGIDEYNLQEVVDPTPPGN